MIDEKTEVVESIKCSDMDSLSFGQHETVGLWVNEQAHKGRREVTSHHEICIEKKVDHPERHWWIISDGLLEGTEPTLRDHADIFDFLLALNLCTDDPVFFSQSPGQVVGGAYYYQKRALNYRGDLSPGNFATALLGMNEIPSEIEVVGDVGSVYNSVRNVRSKRIETDSEADIRIALHLYDDALSSDIWTVITNLYFVCENVLTSGKYSKKDQVIAENTDITIEEAKAWRETVNRLKHPDKGEDVKGMLEQGELAIPSPRRLREAINTILKTELADIGT